VDAAPNGGNTVADTCARAVRSIGTERAAQRWACHQSRSQSLTGQLGATIMPKNPKLPKTSLASALKPKPRRTTPAGN